METTEKIVEAYVRHVKGWATIPNIRCDGQHAIDLIAIDPVSLDRYHIETSVPGSRSYSRLTTRAGDPESQRQPLAKARQRGTQADFVERKFGAAAVKATLGRHGFVEGDYSQVIVTWDWTPEGRAVATKAGITLWHFQDILREIAMSIRDRHSAFANDTLRTINLFVRALAAAEAKEDGPHAAAAPVPEPSPRAVKPVSTAGPVERPYWVYRNWIHNRARLHRSSCSYCNNGAGIQGANASTTGEWTGFDDREAAEAHLLATGCADAAVCWVCG